MLIFIKIIPMTYQRQDKRREENGRVGWMNKEYNCDRVIVHSCN